MSTQDKVVVITGASQGIGAGLVQGFHEHGYRVVANCNRDAGQTVFHVHFHLLAGRPMSWPRVSMSAPPELPGLMAASVWMKSS